MTPSSSLQALLPFEPTTAPPLYRSEGFAEDLFDEEEAPPAGSPYAPGRLQRGAEAWLSALPLAVTVLSAAASVLA